MIFDMLSEMLRPQDVLLAFHLTGPHGPTQRAIGQALGISQAEVSLAIGRLQVAQLVVHGSRTVVMPNLIEFLVHGARYMFPPLVGGLKRGVPTAALVQPLKGKVGGATGSLVWPHAKGSQRAQSLEPIHKAAPDAALHDPRMYRLLALLDGIRIGGARMRQIAAEHLTAELRSGEQRDAR
jgi:hypothetical protein